MSRRTSGAVLMRSANERLPDVSCGSKAEELTASTTGLLHPWELTISQMLRLGGSGPQAGISSILTVRTLGRCKPVAQSLTKAAVPDAI
jgi:hypothetical protein